MKKWLTLHHLLILCKSEVGQQDGGCLISLKDDKIQLHSRDDTNHILLRCISAHRWIHRFIQKKILCTQCDYVAEVRCEADYDALILHKSSN